MGGMRARFLPVVSMLVLAGCSGAAEPIPEAPSAGAPSALPTTPLRSPLEPVDVDDVVVVAAPPITPLVLDPVPDGVKFRRVTAGPIEQPSADFDQFTSSATLYGDPHAADPLGGPVLLIGTSSGSATIAGPRTDVAGTHPVDIDIGFGGATFVPDGDRSWVMIPAGYEDYAAFVIGRGVSEDELVAAARAADFLGAPPTIDAGSLPAGLVTLVAGVPGDGPGSWQGEQVEFMVEGVSIQVSVVRADPQLATLWGFWVRSESDAVDGPSRRSGPMPGTKAGDDAYGVVWADGGNVVSVVGLEGTLSGRGPDAIGAIVDPIAAALLEGTHAELAEIAELVLEPPTPAEINCPTFASLITGRTGDVRWAYAAGPDVEWDSPLHQCSAVINPIDGIQSGDDITHADSELPPVGAMIPGTTAGYLTLDRPEHDGIIRAGIAPPGTVRVVITAPDLTTQEALLGGRGPRPGEQLFAAYFPGDWSERVMERAFTAAAFDADGVMIDDAVLP